TRPARRCRAQRTKRLGSTGRGPSALAPWERPGFAAHRSNIREWYCPQARIAGHLTFRPLAWFRPHCGFPYARPAVWLLCHIPPAKSLACFDDWTWQRYLRRPCRACAPSTVRPSTCRCRRNGRAQASYTIRAASSSVGSRPCGVSWSTKRGRCWVSSESTSPRSIPVCLDSWLSVSLPSASARSPWEIVLLGPVPPPGAPASPGPPLPLLLDPPAEPAIERRSGGGAAKNAAQCAAQQVAQAAAKRATLSARHADVPAGGPGRLRRWR